MPPGAVVGQDPAAKEEAKRGAAVRLTLSSGPEEPTGTPGPTAQDSPEGPEAGSDAPDPAAEGPVAVPDVSSVGVDEATRALAAAGCSVSGTTEVPSPEPAGTVLGTDPPVGTAVEPGTAVTLVVSAGSPPEDPMGADASGQYQYAPDEDSGVQASPAAPAAPPDDPAPAEPAEPATTAPPADPAESAAEPAPYDEPAPAERAAEPAAYDYEYPEDEAEDQYEDSEPED